MDNKEILKVNDGEEVGMAADVSVKWQIWCDDKKQYVDGTGCGSKICTDCNYAMPERPKEKKPKED